MSSCLPPGQSFQSASLRLLGKDRRTSHAAPGDALKGKSEVGPERRAKGNSFPHEVIPSLAGWRQSSASLRAGGLPDTLAPRTPGHRDVPQLHLFQRMSEMDWIVQTQKIKGYFPPFGLKKKFLLSFLTLPPSLRDWLYLKNCILPRHSKLLRAWSKAVE